MSVDETASPPSMVRRVLLFVAIALVSAAATLLLTRERLPELDRPALRVAEGHWRSRDVPSYTLELEIEGSGVEKGRFHVRVDRGEVVELTRNGLAVTADRSAYTIPGLHAMLDREIELSENPAASFGAPAGYKAHLFAEFDVNGVPLRFRRLVGGTNSWVDWRILSFAAD